jgi:hypothetical protein
MVPQTAVPPAVETVRRSVRVAAQHRLGLGDVDLDLDADLTAVLGRGRADEVCHLAGELAAFLDQSDALGDLSQRVDVWADAAPSAAHVVQILGVAQRRRQMQLMQARATAKRELLAE